MRDTPTGILIGSQPRIRKGFVIKLTNGGALGFHVGRGSVDRNDTTQQRLVLGADDTGAAGVPRHLHLGLHCETLQPALDEAPRCVPFSARGDTLCGVETILSVLQVAIAVITIFLILMHSGKDSGLSGAFGVGSGTGPLGGGSLVERNLNRWTIFFSVLFFLNAGVLLTRPWA